jgi:hypothetical protein
MLPVEHSRSQGPQELSRHAAENLRFIRETMQGTSAFTAVPGYGGALIGLTAVLAAGLSSLTTSTKQWLWIWIVEAFVAVLILAITMTRKARRAQLPLLEGPGRRFLMSLAPGFVAGAFVSLALIRLDQIGLIPGTWLLLYGVAVATGGMHSVRAVPTLGWVCMSLGALATVLSPAWGNLALALGFGVLHVVFGLYIARKHGG